MTEFFHAHPFASGLMLGSLFGATTGRMMIIVFFDVDWL